MLHDIFWFEVSMDDSVIVQLSYTIDNLSENIYGLELVDFLFRVDIFL